MSLLPGTEENHKNLNHDIQSCGQDSNQTSNEYKSINHDSTLAQFSLEDGD